MKRLVSVLLILALVIALAACSKPAPVDYSGTYDIIKIEAAEASATEEDMNALRELGLEAVVSFAEDGTGLMSIADQDSEFTYDAEKGTLILGGVESKMEFGEDGMLIITDDSGVMYLQKRADED